MSAAERSLRAVPMSATGYESAAPADVEREARNWDDSVLECRTYNHKWAPQRATWNAEYRFYHIVQICTSCRSQRTMDMDHRGHLLTKPSISYVDNYLMPPGMGRIVGDAKDVVRLAAVTRTFPMEKITGKKAREAPPRSQHARDELGIAGVG
jgi:hypothetical protein